MNKRIKIIRACTVSMSVGFVTGMLPDLSKQYEVILLSSPGIELEESADKYGVRKIVVQMKRHISLWHDLISLFRLIFIFLKERPVMVHSITPKAGMLCMIAAWVTRVPVRVHTFTGLVFPTASGLKRKILMATDWLTCACATHIIPEGEGVKNDLLKNDITKKPIKVLGHGNVRGIDIEKFDRRAEVMELALKIRKNDVFTYLFVGRIVKDKGINELCQAMEKLAGFSPVRLFLVGDYEDNLDPISSKSREIIENNPSIEMVGLKYDDELLAYYAAADCFVLPSYREGFPNTVLEAGAMGLPSIVTDINGSREIIIQGENGVIVPSLDAEALYKAMLDMMKDKKGRERMAGNARKMIVSRFEQGYVRKCLYNYYDEILDPYKD